MDSGPPDLSKLQRGHSPAPAEVPPPPPAGFVDGPSFLAQTLSSLLPSLVLAAFNHSASFESRISPADLFKSGYLALEKIVRKILLDEFPALSAAALESVIIETLSLASVSSLVEGWGISSKALELGAPSPGRDEIIFLRLVGAVNLELGEQQTTVWAQRVLGTKPRDTKINLETNGDDFTRALFVLQPIRERQPSAPPPPVLDAQNQPAPLPLPPVVVQNPEEIATSTFGADLPFASPPPRYLHEILGRLAPSTVQTILTHPSADRHNNQESFFEERGRRSEVFLEVAMSTLRELKPDASESFARDVRSDLMTESSASSIVGRWDLRTRIVLGDGVREGSVESLPILLGIINGIEVDLGREEAVAWCEPLVRSLVEFSIVRASRPRPSALDELEDRCACRGFTVVFKTNSNEGEVPSSVSIVVGNRYTATGMGESVEAATEDAARILLLSRRVPKFKQMDIIDVGLLPPPSNREGSGPSGSTLPSQQPSIPTLPSSFRDARSSPSANEAPANLANLAALPLAPSSSLATAPLQPPPSRVSASVIAGLFDSLQTDETKARQHLQTILARLPPTLVTTIFTHPSMNKSDNYLNLLGKGLPSLRRILHPMIQTRYPDIAVGDKKRLHEAFASNDVVDRVGSSLGVRALLRVREGVEIQKKPIREAVDAMVNAMVSVLGEGETSVWVERVFYPLFKAAVVTLCGVQTSIAVVEETKPSEVVNSQPKSQAGQQLESLAREQHLDVVWKVRPSLAGKETAVQVVEVSDGAAKAVGRGSTLGIAMDAAASSLLQSGDLVKKSVAKSSAAAPPPFTSSHRLPGPKSQLLDLCKSRSLTVNFATLSNDNGVWREQIILGDGTISEGEGSNRYNAQSAAARAMIDRGRFSEEEMEDEEMDAPSNEQQPSISNTSSTSDPKGKKRKLVAESSSISSPRLPPPQPTPNQKKRAEPPNQSSSSSSSDPSAKKKKTDSTTTTDVAPSSTPMHIDEPSTLPRFNSLSLEPPSTSSSILTKPKKHLARLATRLGLDAPSYEPRTMHLDKNSGRSVYKERVLVGEHAEKGFGWTQDLAQKDAALRLMRSGKLGVVEGLE